MTGLLARLNQDVCAGLMFLLFGALSLVLGRNYPVGTAWQMGSGYFPTVLGSSLIALGGYIAILGWVRSRAAAFEGWALRPTLFICSAFLLFAVMIEQVGFLITAPICMLLGARATPAFRLKPQLLLAVASTLLAAAIFILGLKLPIALLPAFLGP